jgi:hypothetical protein
MRPAPEDLAPAATLLEDAVFAIGDLAFSPEATD